MWDFFGDGVLVVLCEGKWVSGHMLQDGHYDAGLSFELGQDRTGQVWEQTVLAATPYKQQ